MRTRLKILISVVVLLLVFGDTRIAVAQEEISKLPSEQAARIEEFIQREMKASKIPGLAVGIVHGDEIVYTKGFGVADEKETLVTMDTPFYIGSVGKTFTALAIRQLIGEGKIYPNACVTEYIPWFRLADHTGEQMTVENLLEHTSGLSNIAGNAAYSYNGEYTIEEAVREINKREETNRPVGSSYEYSNLNYVILGLIVEYVSELSYDDYIQRNIYEPMQMVDSYNSEEEAILGGLAQGYRELYGINVPIDYEYPNGQVPAGYQLSSVADMSNYMVYFLNNGYSKGKSIIPNNKLEPAVDTKKPIQNLASYYGLDWGVTNDPAINDYNRFYGFMGATPHFNSAMLLSQIHRYGIIVLVNQRGSYHKPELTAQLIGNGISDILLHNTIPAPYVRTKDTKVFILPILVLLLTIISIISCIRFRTGITTTRHWKTILLMMLINIVFPILLLIGLPALYDCSWRFMLNNGIDTGLPVFTLCIVLLITGMVKLTVLRVELRKRKDA